MGPLPGKIFSIDFGEISRNPNTHQIEFDFEIRLTYQQDYLYNSEELSFMKEQLALLEEEVAKLKRKKPQGFGK